MTKTKGLKAKDSWLDDFFVQRGFSVTWVKVRSEEENGGRKWNKWDTWEGGEMQLHAMESCLATSLHNQVLGAS